MLDAAQHSLEANVALALVHEIGGSNEEKLLSIAIGSEINLHGTPELIAAQAAREAGNAPNAVLAAAASIVGPRRAEAARACVRVLVDAFAQAGLVDAADDAFDLRTVHLDPAARRLFVGEQPDARAQALLPALGA